jgi:hypothetical protein
MTRPANIANLIDPFAVTVPPPPRIAFPRATLPRFSAIGIRNQMRREILCSILLSYGDGLANAQVP